MSRKPLTAQERERGLERRARFRSIYKKFDSVEEGNQYVAKVLGCSKITASLWRSKNVIPEIKLKVLLDAIKKDNRFKAF